jgi:NitT/TauT family transport system substrate-binding protein
MITFALFIAAAAGGYFWHMIQKAPQPAPYAGPVEKLSIGTIRSEISALLWIADKNGYFEQQGLEVTLKVYQAGRFAVDEVLAGKIDLAACADFVFAVVTLKSGENLRVLATIAAADIHEVIARKDRGLNRPQDLTGKKIGVTRETSGEFFLATFLSFNGIAPAEVELVNLKPYDLKEALAGGTVDAVMAWEPNVSEIKTRLGDQAVAWPGQSGQKFYWLLVGADKVIKTKPQALVRLFQALRQAEDFARKNPEAAKAMVAQRLEVAPAYINHMWPKGKYALSLDQPLLLALEDQSRMLLKNRPAAGKEIPNYLNYLYVEALRQAAPDAVRIVGTGREK